MDWTNNGDLFWQGDYNGSPSGGRYTNWGIQPDNAGGAENASSDGASLTGQSLSMTLA